MRRSSHLLQFCRICDKQNLIHVQSENRGRETYTVVCCKSCRTVQTLEHYDPVSPDYISINAEDIDNHRIWQQGEHKRSAFEQWWAAAKQLGVAKGDKVLDVGCGTGGFLAFAQDRGLIPYGFDASAAQADYAAKRIPTVRSAFTLGEYISQLGCSVRFDVITIWDVLEHIREPAVFLKQLAEHLEQHGLLFVSVPNGQAVGWKKFLYFLAGKSPELSPWEHVFYYSPSSLEICLKRCDLDTVRTGAVVCYVRPWSLKEFARRIAFAALHICPTYAPQIFCWAQRHSPNMLGTDHV